MHAIDARRRAALLGSAAAALLSACGGGGGDTAPAPTPTPPTAPPPEPPRILGFEAAAATHFVGDTALLTARFSGGQGRIEPNIGVVQNQVAVQTPVLDRSRRYTLVVEAAGHAPLRQELDIGVGFRNRYQSLALPFPLLYHAVAATADGSLLLIGGSRSGSTLSDAIDRYDPRTRAITRIGSLHSGRCDHSAITLPDGRVMVLGGQISLSGAPWAELIDPVTGVSTPTGRMHWPRARHAALGLGDGRVLVAGGVNRDSLEIWEPQTQQFRLVTARMAHSREFPSLTQLNDGRVLIAGGWHGAAQNRFAEVFDPATDRLEPLGDEIDERRAMHQAFRQADGSVLLLGGELMQSDGDALPQDGVLRFDPARGRFERQAALPTARTLVRGVQLPDQQMLLFGGEDGLRQVTESASVYRPDGSSAALAAMPAGRAWHTVSRLPDGRLLILGGSDALGNALPSALLYE